MAGDSACLGSRRDFRAAHAVRPEAHSSGPVGSSEHSTITRGGGPKKGGGALPSPRYQLRQTRPNDPPRRYRSLTVSRLLAAERRSEPISSASAEQPRP